MLYAAFAIVALAGIVLLFTDGGQQPQQTPTEVEVQAPKIIVKAKGRSEGLIPIALGMSGLILLTIKVPVRWVSYRRRAMDIDNRFTMDAALGGREKDFSEVEKIPLLVWWLIKGRASLVRAKS